MSISGRSSRSNLKLSKAVGFNYYPSMADSISMSNVCPLDYRYGHEDMKAVFSEASRIQYQMMVEAALARAHASLGTISKEAAEEITRVASLDVVSVDRIKEIEKETRHDVMAMVKAMTEKCNGEAGKYVHLGATSNDIVDTATALQLRSAMEIVLEDVDDLIMTFASLAKRERDTLEIGRTHAQFAIPITYGFKVSGYIAEMIRHRVRIVEAMPRVCAGKMAGAVGTGAALGKNFFEVQRRVMADLELTYEPAATQVVGRDRYTEAICIMANIAASLERYCTEVRNLQRSEVAEASEFFDVKKQVGSSTMAQKRNPMNSENVCGLARVVRGFVTPAFESQILWHERDLCNSSTERFTLPHVFVLIDEILKKTAWIYSGIEIHRDRMLENIESSKGLVMAEPLMMKLTEKGMGRQDAHEVIRQSAMIAEDTGKHLRDVLLQREDLKGILTPDEIIATMDASNYVGGAREIVDKMVVAAEDVVGRKVE